MSQITLEQLSALIGNLDIESLKELRSKTASKLKELGVQSKLERQDPTVKVSETLTRQLSGLEKRLFAIETEGKALKAKRTLILSWMKEAKKGAEHAEGVLTELEEVRAKRIAENQAARANRPSKDERVKARAIRLENRIKVSAAKAERKAIRQAARLARKQTVTTEPVTSTE